MAKKKQAAQATAEDDEGPSTSGPELSKVMYIGHLPHGFYEQQLKGFFSQFGQIIRLRVSRNKKTGRAKHYAFLEFKTSEVAQIAAEAMDGYMLFTQKLDCHVLPTSQLHKDLFKGANRTFKRIPWRKIEAQRHDRVRTEEQQEQRVNRAINRDQKRQMLLNKAGIEYTYKPLSQKSKRHDDSENGQMDEPAKLSKASKDSIGQIKSNAAENKVAEVVKKAKVGRVADTKVKPVIAKRTKSKGVKA